MLRRVVNRIHASKGINIKNLSFFSKKYKIVDDPSQVSKLIFN